MKLELALSAAQDICRRICAAHDIALVTPGSPGYEILRTVVIGGLQAIPGTPVTDETLDHVQRRVSFALPPVGAVEALKLIPTAGPVLADLAARIGADKVVVLIAPEVWGETWALLKVIAHEVGHALAIQRVLRDGGSLALVVWCLAYGLNASARGWLEACEYTANVQGDILFDQADPDEAVNRTVETLKSYVGDDETALTIARDTLQSAADSMMTGAPHGEGTPFAEVLAEVSKVTGKQPVFDAPKRLWVWISSER